MKPVALTAAWPRTPVSKDAMELLTAIRARRSTAPVTEEAPTDAELAAFVQVAAHSPDHAGLRPWRLISLRDRARVQLGEALVAGFGDAPGTPAAAKTAAKTLRAPVLLTVIGVPIDHPKVPAWEQVAAIGAFIATLQLVLFDAGYTAMWRTGPAVELPQVRDLLGVQPSEQLRGWLYLGGTAATNEPPEIEPDVTGKLTTLTDLEQR